MNDLEWAALIADEHDDRLRSPTGNTEDYVLGFREASQSIAKEIRTLPAATPARLPLRAVAELAEMLQGLLDADDRNLDLSDAADTPIMATRIARAIADRGIAWNVEKAAEAYFNETRENLTIERCEWGDVAEYVKAQMRERVAAILKASL